MIHMVNKWLVSRQKFYRMGNIGAAVCLFLCLFFLAVSPADTYAAAFLPIIRNESGNQPDSQADALVHGSQRVFDQAGLFSGPESADLEQKIGALREETGMDAVLVTTDDAGGKTAETYAEDFYIQGQFGVGDDYSGVLFLIDMDNRELYLTPVGNMNRYLTEDRWNAILDETYNGASDGDYAASAQAFVNGVSHYYQKGIPSNQYNYDEDTGAISRYRSIQWYEALLALAVAAIAACSACGGVAAQYAMKRERKQSGNYLMAYKADCAFAFHDSRDDFVSKHVTHVIIPKNNGGGGHSGGSSSGRSTTHSSSGRSFGGGGRKF